MDGITSGRRFEAYNEDTACCARNSGVGSADERNEGSGGTINGGRDPNANVIGALGFRARGCGIRFSGQQLQPFEQRDQPSWERKPSHLPLKSLTTLWMSAVLRARRVEAGMTAAAKAVAPQARTEKTVEKRILTERLRTEVKEL